MGVEDNVNILKWLVWGWYIIALWWMLNRLWDVFWAIDEIGLLTNVKSIIENWLICWLASVNGIRDGWLGCHHWLVSANGIWDRWPGCDEWLASANGIWNWWSGFDHWLTSANGIQDWWSSCDWWLALANSIRDGWPGCDWWLDDRVVIDD